jgi:SAM-dependent methyltransferase
MAKFLFQIPSVRERYCRLRFNMLKKKLTELDKVDSSNVLHSKYSASHFTNYSSFKWRVDYLIRTLKLVMKKTANEQILSIGPRTESELYGFRGLGFAWKNIFAIDTFTYSPKIQQGDMHDISFPDDTFDYVVCGWVLAYSASPEKALSEIRRVMKFGARLIVTWELPQTDQNFDLSKLKIFRATNLNDPKTEIADGFLIDKLKNYLDIERFEIGHAEFYGDTKFVTLILKKI